MLRAHYSFTELKGVDWKQVTDTYGKRADQAKTPLEFVESITPMLAQLQDIHVWIVAPDGQQVHPFRSTYKANFDHAIVQSRLTDLKRFPGIGFTGRVNDVGFIAVTALPADADYEPMLANVREMQDVRGFVIDLRRNSGGSETRAAEIAGLFTTQPGKYANAMVRGADGEMHERPPRLLAPSATPAANVPVICLIGPGCVSSGEGFALMMKSLPQVKLIGQPTRGASGNPQPVLLSNGVRVWFSGWISLELDGSVIEGRGVLPETLIEHEEGADRTFDQAIDFLSL